MVSEKLFCLIPQERNGKRFRIHKRRKRGSEKTRQETYRDVKMHLTKQGLTFPGAQGHMPPDFAVGP